MFVYRKPKIRAGLVVFLQLPSLLQREYRPFFFLEGKNRVDASPVILEGYPKLSVYGTVSVCVYQLMEAGACLSI